MPTGNQLKTSPRDILVLARELLADLKRIQELNNQLAQDLKDVSQTWQDDSFTEVCDFVIKINESVNERGDSIAYTAQQLALYAQALLETK